jgi:hypothetical protein
MKTPIINRTSEDSIMAYLAAYPLLQMSIRELSKELLLNEANDFIYRREIKRRLDANDPQALEMWGFTLNRRPTTGPFQPVSSSEVPDIRPLWEQVLLNNVPLTDLAKIILASEWRYNDPKGLMKMSPEAVRDFLESLEWQPMQYYRDLSEERQKTLYMITDVYGRWYRQQIKNDTKK